MTESKINNSVTVDLDRPIALQKATRLIRWHYQLGNKQVLDLTKVSAKDLATLREQGRQLAGPTGYNTYAKSTQCLVGAQLAVAAGVSRDLERSTLSCKAEDIALLAPSIEFIWADPTLPSVLMCSVEALEGMGVIFAVDSKEGIDVSWILALANSKLDSLTNPRARIGAMAGVVGADGDMEPTETEAMRYMGMLCLKVLAFSQIPQFAPVQVTRHSDLKKAGLLEGIKHRPARPAFAVRYLPRVIQSAVPSSGEGKAHRFLGRAGHIRHFNSAYFTHAKGTWKYIPPVSAPPGVKIQYRVRYITAPKGA